MLKVTQISMLCVAIALAACGGNDVDSIAEKQFSSTSFFSNKAVKIMSLPAGWIGLPLEMVGIGDINRDGYDDFASSTRGGSTPAGPIRAVSGRDGSVLWSAPMPPSVANIKLERFGTYDNTTDVLIVHYWDRSTPARKHILELRRSGSGALVFSLELPTPILKTYNLKDLDGDGRAEIGVTTDGMGSGATCGAVFVGQNLSQQIGTCAYVITSRNRQWNSFQPVASPGMKIANYAFVSTPRLYDVNGNTRPELVLATVHADPMAAGVRDEFDVSFYELLWKNGSVSLNHVHQAVRTRLPSFTNPGYPQWWKIRAALSIPTQDPEPLDDVLIQLHAALAPTPLPLMIFPLGSKTHTAPIRTRSTVFDTVNLSIIGDLDRDGKRDVFQCGRASRYQPGADRMWVLSGADISVELAVIDEKPYGFPGCSAVPAGDVNGDGLPDMLAPEPYSDPGIWSPTANAPIGARSGALRATIDQFEVNSSGILLTGGTAPTAPGTKATLVVQVGEPDPTWYVGGNPVYFEHSGSGLVSLPVTVLANGTWSISVRIPRAPQSFAAFTFTGQLLVTDGSLGFSVSNGYVARNNFP